MLRTKGKLIDSIHCAASNIFFVSLCAYVGENEDDRVDNMVDMW